MNFHPVLLLALTLVPAPFAWGAAPVSTEQLASDYRYCTTCHGATGNGNAAIQAPSLAGIEPWYLEAQLSVYREARRGRDHTVDATGSEMRTVAREIGPDRLAAIAPYVARFRHEPQAPTVIGTVAAGKSLYATHCAACHGRKAEGNQALQAPSLVRLNDWYVVSALRKYRDGHRGTDPAFTLGVAMRAATLAAPADLSLEDIARYLNTLQPAAKRSKP